MEKYIFTANSLNDLFADIKDTNEEEVMVDECEADEDFEYQEYSGPGYEWTQEDSWDALTDGMYGEMPSSPWEYDAMMESMGY